MSRRSLLRTMVLLAALIAGAAVVWQAATTLRSEAVPAAAAVGGPFELTGADGAPVRDTDFRGKWMLVFFGFTSCPDICPATLTQVTGALEKLGPHAKVAPIFITVDPERDTPAKMRVYMENFPGVTGLTGTPEAIGKAISAYKAYAGKETDPSSPDGYTMSHSSYLYIMDTQGRYVRHLPHTATPDDIVAALHPLLTASEGN